MEIRRDSSALFRHYDEYLEYYPLGVGERRSQYHSRLLANQRMPMDPDTDLAIAVAYAKKHWDIYMEYPRDVQRAVGYAKEDAAKAKADEAKAKEGKANAKEAEKTRT